MNRDKILSKSKSVAALPANLGFVCSGEQERYSIILFNFFDNTRPKLTLDSQGKILLTNKRADRLLSSHILIKGMGGRLAFRSPIVTKQVQNILIDMTQGRYSCTRMISNLDDRWYSFDFELAKIGRQKEIILTVNEDTYYMDCTHDSFAHAFSLTLTEAQVVKNLAMGHCPKEIASQMSISTNTVRAHLRSIYSKTDVRSFNKLLHLVMRLTR